MKTLFPILIGFTVSLAFSATASAHAFLDHSDPKVGSTVTAVPSVVKAWFTQHLEPAFSTMQVFDSNGTKVDKNDAHVDSDDPSLLIVSLPTLPAGTYTVKWKVVSVDTHRTSGSFHFTIQPKGEKREHG
ncbi:MAG TPA: copper resistance CopC family protein [Tepidisphaeraceae bacterium]|jgi:hypothetical protein|nr:copper resistance CopC family protein [Tepidisphaeraceae bacterium]